MAKLQITETCPAGWTTIYRAQRFEDNEEAVKAGVDYQTETGQPTALVFSKKLPGRYDVITRVAKWA